MEYSIREKIFSSTLYIVPTPIGNLGDITYRALFILQHVDLIAAEDTRHTGVLLKYFSIDTPLFIFHKYNERNKTETLLSKLQSGSSIALVSKSGTPLISDPGYYLVRMCCFYGIRIVPLPGACAAVTALSGSGLPTHRFCFEGFLPVKRQSRINYFQTLLQETRTLIFYDSKYRVVDSLKDMISVFGSERKIVLVRELTKVWESIYRASLQELLTLVDKNIICMKGEMILILEGCSIKRLELHTDVKNLISLLSKELPNRKVIDVVLNMYYGVSRNIIYNYLLEENRQR